MVVQVKQLLTSSSGYVQVDCHGMLTLVAVLLCQQVTYAEEVHVNVLS